MEETTSNIVGIFFLPYSGQFEVTMMLVADFARRNENKWVANNEWQHTWSYGPYFQSEWNHEVVVLKSYLLSKIENASSATSLFSLVMRHMHRHVTFFILSDHLPSLLHWLVQPGPSEQW